MTAPTVPGTVFRATFEDQQAAETWIVRRDTSGNVYYEPVDQSLRDAIQSGRVNTTGWRTSFTRAAESMSDVEILWQPPTPPKPGEQITAAAERIAEAYAATTIGHPVEATEERLTGWATGGLGGPIGELFADLAVAAPHLANLLAEIGHLVDRGDADAAAGEAAHRLALAVLGRKPGDA